jgi:hypothetical protein
VAISFSLRTLCAPKDGSTDAQYEDAWAVSDVGEATSAVISGPLTVALSDGASSAVYARDWARRLVAAFVDAEAGGAYVTDGDLATRVAAEGKVWREAVEVRATSWHAQEKLEFGSAATLLVASIDNTRLRWDALAVGDVCLFVVRGGRLKYAFPVTKAAGFDDRPWLLSTEPRAAVPTIKRFGAAVELNDRILLMTDAMAAWFLATYEKKQRPWDRIPEDAATFVSWLKGIRESGAMKNDDVTMVDIRVIAAHSSNVAE